MVLLVPFDGSELSVAALERARQFGDALDEEVIVLAVVVEDEAYVRERGLIEDGETFDAELFTLELRDKAKKVTPEATFRSERAEDPEDEPYASTTMNVVRTIRRVAGELDADIVFVGSENAARVSQPLTSVGAPVSSDPRYDVHIVRHA